MMKKTLCMLLALILLLSCFAGCAAKPAEEETPAKENNSAAENQENTENNNTNEPAQEETPVDSLRAYEGTTITVAQNQGEYIWDKLYAIGDKFEELTGIKVEWQDIPSSDWDTWYAAQFAAGTEPDILFSMKDKSSYFDQGKLMDLTDYYEQENPFNGRIWKDCFTDGGLDDCYSADGTRLIATAVTYATVNLYYNKDIMNTLGLGDKAPETYSEMFRMHSFSFGIHVGSGSAESLIRECVCFANPPASHSVPIQNGDLPLTGSLLTAEGCAVYALKRAEDADGLILRLFNPQKKAAAAHLHFAKAVQRAELLAIPEWPLGGALRTETDDVYIDMKPEEVVTLRVVF